MFNENVQPDQKGMVLTIPGVLQVYTKYFSSTFFWLHVDFLFQTSESHKFKHSVQKNTWAMLTIHIKDTYLFTQLNGVNYPAMVQCKCIFLFPSKQKRYFWKHWSDFIQNWINGHRTFFQGNHRSIIPALSKRRGKCKLAME